LLPDAQLYFSGLHYTGYPHRLFCNRVTDVRVKGADGAYRPPEAAALYPVVGSLYSAQMLGAVKELTYGILSLEPKDAQGQPVQDYLRQVLYTPEGFELKEWLAFSDYLHALDGGKIPAAYAAPSPRKTIRHSTALCDLLKRPNGFALLVYSGIILLFAAVVFFTIVIIRKLRRAGAKSRKQ
jgi:hypothetical protein